jgi:hypothetical protein
LTDEINNLFSSASNWPTKIKKRPTKLIGFGVVLAENVIHSTCAWPISSRSRAVPAFDLRAAVTLLRLLHGDLNQLDHQSSSIVILLTRHKYKLPICWTK